jgi:hypothetical protein
VLRDKEIICYAHQYPERPVDFAMHMLSFRLSWTICYATPVILVSDALKNGATGRYTAM